MTGIDLPTKRFRMKEVDPLSLHLNRKNFVNELADELAAQHIISRVYQFRISYFDE